jgi:hypothetical protein
MREQEQFGITGWIAAVEVTHSDRNGFHPHLHVVVCFDTPVSNELLGGHWFARFERALGRRGTGPSSCSQPPRSTGCTARSSGSQPVAWPGRGPHLRRGGSWCRHAADVLRIGQLR